MMHLQTFSRFFSPGISIRLWVCGIGPGDNVHIYPSESRLKEASREDLKGKVSAYLLLLWGMSPMSMTFVNSSWCYCLRHLFPCHLLSEPWPWSCSGLRRLMKAWARLISLYSWNFGDGRMEALGYLGEVEWVLRIDAREEKGGLKGCQQHAWPW